MSLGPFILLVFLTFFFEIYFYYFDCVNICVSTCKYVHVSEVAHGGQKRASDALALELQVVVGDPAWPPQNELRSS